MKGVEKLDIKSNLEIISLKVCFKLVPFRAVCGGQWGITGGRGITWEPNNGHRLVNKVVTYALAFI